MVVDETRCDEKDRQIGAGWMLIIRGNLGHIFSKFEDGGCRERERKNQQFFLFFSFFKSLRFALLGLRMWRSFFSLFDSVRQIQQ
jgi:hypothetical protein